MTYLYLNGASSTKDLANELLIPVPVATAIKKELQKCNLITQTRGIELTNLGKRYINSELGYEGIDIKLLSQLLNDDEFINTTIDILSNKYNSFYLNRPTVDVTIDQAKGTPETAFKRALLCLKRGFLIGKKFSVLEMMI